MTGPGYTNDNKKLLMMLNSRFAYVLIMGLALFTLNAGASWWRGERKRRRRVKYPVPPESAVLQEPWEAQIIGWVSLVIGVCCTYSWWGRNIGFAGYALEVTMLLFGAWTIGRHYFWTVAYSENGIETRLSGRTAKRAEWSQISKIQYAVDYGFMLKTPQGWVHVRENLIDFDAFCAAVIQHTIPDRWDNLAAMFLPRLSRSQGIGNSAESGSLSQGASEQ